MAVAGTLDYQAYFGLGTGISLPVNRTSAPFVPNGIYINNRSAKTIQVGPSQQGPFTPMGSYTLATLPWVFGPSLYIAEIGSTAVNATDFLDVHFLSVSGPSGIGAPQIIASAPAGWGPVGPTGAIVNVHAGDPFQYGQIQQVINWLSGILAQPIFVANRIVSTGPSASFQAFDQDGIGNDVVALQLVTGVIGLFSSVLGGNVLSSDESGDVTIPAGDLTVNGWAALLKGAIPATDPAHGHLYIAANGSLHYLGTAGTDTLLAPP